jgi:hypothetical protein
MPHELLGRWMRGQSSQIFVETLVAKSMVYSMVDFSSEQIITPKCYSFAVWCLTVHKPATRTPVPVRNTRL